MRVVDVRRESCTHYIGRIGYYDARRMGEFANLGNIVTLRKESQRKAVIYTFEDWVRNDPGQGAQEFRDRIKKLPEDAVLGCWCAPRPCHGDVIIKLWKEMHGKT